MVKIIPWILMPVSNAVSWYLVVMAAATPTGSSNGGAGPATTSLIGPLFQSVWKVATFYMIWALYNKYLGGRPQEMGHISMGLMALTAFFERRYLSMGACGLVILNFAVIIPFVISKGPTGLAKAVYNDTSTITMSWAYTFILYTLSNLGLWSYVMYRLCTNSVEKGSAPYEPINQEGIL
jgi:hypothetical protein